MTYLYPTKTLAGLLALVIMAIAAVYVLTLAPVTATTSNSNDTVKAFVEKALAYSKNHSKESALKTFTQPGGEFHQGELYIFAYDFSGTVIAHGGNPLLVGKNLLNMKDPKGVPVISELLALARQGAGWLYYTWPNPAHNGKEEPKLGYIVKVDDNWFLGSGTYLTRQKHSSKR